MWQAVNNYASTLDAYLTAGWDAVLPLPTGQKFPPPKGTTGYGTAAPTIEQMRDWATQTNQNICLRLPNGIIGIDVDAYGDKAGAQTLHDLETTLGALPATWLTTSRNDGVSGIRLFRCNTRNIYRSTLGDGIDVIRNAHRYAVVWPSVHPEGRVYQWIDKTGNVTTTVPDVTDIPELPAVWLAFIETAAQPVAPKPQTIRRKPNETSLVSPEFVAAMAERLAIMNTHLAALAKIA